MSPRRGDWKLPVSALTMDATLDFANLMFKTPVELDRPKSQLDSRK